MKSARWFARVLLLALEVVGCGAVPLAGRMAAVADERQVPKEHDGRPMVSCRESSGVRPPLRPSDIRVIGTGSFDMVSTALFDSDGALTVIYEAFGDAGLNNARLEAVTSLDCGQTFTPPKHIDLGPAAVYRTTPSAVKLGEHQYLYFVSADSLNGPSTVLRSRFEEGVFGEPEPVELGGVRSLLSWPRFIEGPEGVAVAYRTSVDRVASLASSADGRTFAAPMVVHEGKNAMVRTAFFRNGAAIATYQNGSVERTLSWWRIWSQKNQKWTEPVLVTTTGESIHDTIPFQRSDGEIDLYYVYSTLELTDTFKLHRRSLTREGVLGPEELVTDLGSPSKPNLARLPGGKVLLMYADITQINELGYPQVQVVKTAVLADDAPRP